MTFPNTYEGLVAARVHSGELHHEAMSLDFLVEQGDCSYHHAKEALELALDHDFSVVMPLEQSLLDQGDAQLLAERERMRGASQKRRKPLSMEEQRVDYLPF